MARINHHRSVTAARRRRRQVPLTPKTPHLSACICPGRHNGPQLQSMHAFHVRELRLYPFPASSVTLRKHRDKRRELAPAIIPSTDRAALTIFHVGSNFAPLG